jgi:hypothetical protein
MKQGTSFAGTRWAWSRHGGIARNSASRMTRRVGEIGIPRATGNRGELARFRGRGTPGCSPRARRAIYRWTACDPPTTVTRPEVATGERARAPPASAGVLNSSTRIWSNASLYTRASEAAVPA